MASVLDGLRKKLNKAYEDKGIEGDVFHIGVSEDKFKSTFSLGSPSLDMLTYNSIPEGIFIEVVGPESSGKTTLAFKIASDFIKKEKQKPKEERRHIMFVDAEGTADPYWAKVSSGYDMNDTGIETLYETPLGASAEEILTDVATAVQTGKIGLVIFDSLVSIAPKQVNGESMEKKDMGGVAKLMSDFVRRNTGLFHRYRTTFIGINGIYYSVDGYGNPERTSGGTAWKRACSLRLKTKRGPCYDKDGKELKDTDPGAIGHIIEVALLKTKFCRWDRKLGRCHLDYTRGFDILQDTIDVATFFGIIQNVSQGHYIVTDPDSGEPISEKIKGKANIKPFFEEHLDVWKRVYDKVYEMMSRKDNPNDVSFEKMLNINVEELFGINFEQEAEENG